jgi:hypothetical protein
MSTAPAANGHFMGRIWAVFFAFGSFQVKDYSPYSLALCPLEALFGDPHAH